MPLKFKFMFDGVNEEVRAGSYHRPHRAHPDDAGLDLVSCFTETVAPNMVTELCTGIAVDIPKGYVGLLTLRSGFSKKYNCMLVNGVGIIDSGYHGEIKANVYRFSNSGPLKIEAGQRFAQLTIVPCLIDDTEHDNEHFLKHKTERGTGGFGSTGE